MSWKLYDDLVFSQAKGTFLFDIKCTGCNNIVKRSKNSILNSLNLKINDLYCSRACTSKNTKKNRPVISNCVQ